MERIDPEFVKARPEISGALNHLSKRVTSIIAKYADYWPLSVRQVHYRLLSLPPFVRNINTSERYQNDLDSYGALSGFLLRARINGLVPWEAIDDTTRPVSLGGGYDSPEQYYKVSWDVFLAFYSRKLLQSQPDHIEIVAEKLTVKSILSEVASKYTMPLTISRGFNSGTIKQKLFDRFERSGKSRFKLLMLSDLDPTGESIALDMVNCLRRDCGMDREELEAYKVALTFEQVREFKLPPMMKAKGTDPSRKRFIEKHKKDDVFEPEALEPADLASLLDQAIAAVIDMELFNQELETEKADKAKIKEWKAAMPRPPSIQEEEDN